MAYKRSHYIALLFSLFALVLWIFSNLGTTISSTVLAETFVVQAIQTKTGQSIRYGIYNSCIYSNKSQIASCSPSSFGYQIGNLSFEHSSYRDQLISFAGNSKDVNQLAQINSVDPDAGNKISQIISTELKSALALQKVSVLVMPAAVLSFISVCGKYITKMGGRRKIVLTIENNAQYLFHNSAHADAQDANEQYTAYSRRTCEHSWLCMWCAEFGGICWYLPHLLRGTGTCCGRSTVLLGSRSVHYRRSMRVPNHSLRFFCW